MFKFFEALLDGVKAIVALVAGVVICYFCYFLVSS